MFWISEVIWPLSLLADLHQFGRLFFLFWQVWSSNRKEIELRRPIIPFKRFLLYELMILRHIFSLLASFLYCFLYCQYSCQFCYRGKCLKKSFLCLTICFCLLFSTLISFFFFSIEFFASFLYWSLCSFFLLISLLLFSVDLFAFLLYWSLSFFSLCYRERA